MKQITCDQPVPAPERFVPGFRPMPGFGAASQPTTVLSRSITLLTAVGLVFVATGCLSRPALKRETFALESPPATAQPSTKGSGVLGIRSFEVSPLFAGESFVYRIGAESYEHDPYAGFLVSPDRALGIPVRAYLRNTGVFRDVAESGSLLQADRLLEVRVTELYGDLRTFSKPAAVLSMRFTFFQSEKGKPPAVYFEKGYSRRIDLRENTAASVVAGWNKALGEIMSEMGSELAAAK